MNVILVLTIMFSPFWTQATLQLSEGGIQNIEGVYEIDLRPTPDDAPYMKEFIIAEVDGNRFRGFFYDSEFTSGQLNLNWDEIYFAFTTRDNSNTYYHSGRIVGNRVYGITYSPGRELTAPWVGGRSK